MYIDKRTLKEPLYPIFQTIDLFVHYGRAFNYPQIGKKSG